MKLGNSWIVNLAVLRENESSSDSRRRTDLGAEGSVVHTPAWVTRKGFLWSSVASVYSC